MKKCDHTMKVTVPNKSWMCVKCGMELELED